MNDESEREVPEGAAVFPLIPEELGIHPLLLAVLHATVFFDGSEDAVIDPDAADEAMEYLVGYLQRLEGPALDRVREDLACLKDYARQQDWPKPQQRFLTDFLNDYVLGGEEEA